MANTNNKFSIITQLQFDNGQAVKKIKGMRDDLTVLQKAQKESTDRYKALIAAGKAASDEEVRAAKKQMDLLNTQVKAQKALLQQTEQDMSMLRRAIDDMDKMSLRQLNKALNEAKKKMNSLGGEKGNPEQLRGITELMSQIDGRIKQVKAGFADVWRTVKSGSIESSSEMERAIKTLEEYRGELAKDNTEFEKMGNYIVKMKVQLAEMKDMGVVSRALGDGSGNKLNETQLKDYIKFYQDISKSSMSSAEQVQSANEKIAKAQEQLNFKKLDAASKIIGQIRSGSYNKTMEETANDIKLLQESIDKMSASNVTGIAATNKAIEALKAYSKQADETNMRIAKTGTALNEGGQDNTTIPQLKEYIKYYQDIATSAKSSNEDIKKANEEIAKAQKVIDDRNNRTISRGGRDLMMDALGNQFSGTIAQTKEAIEQLKKFKDTLDVTDARGIKDVDTAIDKLNKKIEHTTERYKRIQDMDKNWRRYTGDGRTGFTNEQLKEYIQYYKDVATSAKSSAEQVRAANEKIAKAQEILKANENMEIANKAGQIMSKMGVTSPDGKDNWSKTISETKEAIELMKKYRDTIATTDPSKLQKIDKTIEQLNKHIAKTDEELLRAKELMESFAGKDEEGQQAMFQRMSAEQLEANRKRLEAYQRTLKKTGEDSKGLMTVKQMLTEIERQQVKLNAAAINWENFRGDNLKKRSLDELKSAYSALQAEVNKLTRGQEEYNQKAAMLKEIDAEIKEVTNDVTHHNSAFENAASRLKTYIAVYLGFNALRAKLSEAWNGLKELSDEMTNVQKVTNLTDDEIDDMTNSLQRLDTRTARTELMALAEQAGKMGIAAQGGAEALVQFVKAGQMITSTLGEDIGGAEAVGKLLKINDLINKESTNIEQDMNKIGSAILSIGNNSKASYADVVNFTTRLGSVGAVANMSMQEIMALGGTFSALGGDIDSSSTAMSRVLIALQTKTDEIARATKVSVSELRQMIAEGKTMDALYEVLVNVREEGAAGIDALLKAVGGKNNAQAKAAIATLTSHLETLQYQLALSKDGYEDGTLAIQEFERMNDNLAGTMERVGHEFEEVFVNSTYTKGASMLAKSLLWIVQSMRQSVVVTGLFVGTLATFVVGVGKALFSITSLRKAMDMLGANMPKVAMLFRALGNVIVSTTQGVNAMRAAWGELKKALMANWFGLVMTAVATGVALWQKYANAEKEAATRAAELTQQTEEEVANLRYLETELKKTNLSKERRKELTDEWNSKFGQYNHNLITEASSYDEIAMAADKAAAAIERKAAAQLRSEGLSKAMEHNEEEANEAVAGIRSKVSGIIGMSDVEKEQYIKTILSTVNAELRKRAGEIGNDGKWGSEIKGAIFDSVYNSLKKDFGNNANRIKTRGVFSSLRTYIEDYIDVQRNTQMEQGIYNVRADAADMSAKKLYKSSAERGFSNVDVAYGDYLEGKAKGSKVIDMLYDAFEAADEAGMEVANRYRKMLVDLAKNTKSYGISVDVYKDMANANGEDLAKLIDELENMAATFNPKQITSDVFPNLLPLLPKGYQFWTKDDAVKWAYDEATKARKYLEQMNMNRNAKFKWEEGGNKKKEEKEDMEAALKRLDEYYKRREEYMTIALNQEELTEAEYNRRMVENEGEHLQERQNLRRKFMDASQEFDHEYIADMMKDVNFDKINSYVEKEGAKLTDALKLEIAKDGAKIQTDIKAQREAVNKVLFGDNGFTKLTETFTKDIDLLELLLPGIKTDENGNYDAQHLEKEIRVRTHLLLSLVKDGVKMNQKELSDAIAKYNMVNADEWVLNDSQMEMLLNRFKKFSLEYNKELRKHANEIARQIDEINAENGFEDRYKNLEKDKELKTQNTSQLLELGNAKNIFGMSSADKMEIEMYDLKIERLKALQQQYAEYYEQLIKGAKDIDEVQRLQRERDYLMAENQTSITELIGEQQRKQAELTIATIEGLRPYSDMVNQFAEDFGTKIFGDVKERKAAAKALLTQFTKTTMALLTQELNYIAMSRMANKAAKAEELTDTANEAIQSNAINSAKGAGQEVGKRGLAGFATSAAIMAGMALLTGIITAALNKGKSELGITSGKVSSEMLTYAAGRYPTYGNGTMNVRGNDGRDYRAVVKPELTTGEYSKPHLGIVGEQGAELIVDHKTYMGLKEKAPYILNGIYDMHRYGHTRMNYEHINNMAAMLNGGGRSVNGGKFKTYAKGNVDEMLGDMSAFQDGESNVRLTEALERNNAVMERMLNEGVKSKIVMYGTEGLYENIQKANRFMKGK